MEFSMPIRKISKFDILADRIPEKMSERTFGFLHSTYDAFQIASIPNLYDVVSYTPYSWKWKINSIQMFIRCEFDTRLSIIDQIAEVLTPVYLNYFVLPFITPFNNKIWQQELEMSGRLFRYIEQKGVFTFAPDILQ